jgi:hypothetical protein
MIEDDNLINMNIKYLIKTHLCNNLSGSYEYLKLIQKLLLNQKMPSVKFIINFSNEDKNVI